MLVIFIVCFATSSEGTLIIMCAVYATVMVISNLAMDENSQWEIFALTMPVTRRQLVLAKYIVAIFYALLGIVVGTVATLVIRLFGFSAGDATLWELLQISLIGIVIAAIFIALLLPVDFKYGVQKGRLVLFGVAAFIGGGGVLLSGKEEMLDSFFSRFSGTAGGLFFGSLSLLFLLISFTVSSRIMEKKEF
ncbi:MAG: ABC-2 transporter permease, partial [Anaerovoracaceae bacterium]